MKKAFGISFVVIVILMVISLFYYLFSQGQTNPDMYKTESPFKTTIVKKTVATGSVVPKKEIDIKPQVSGIIEQLYVKAGDLVALKSAGAYSASMSSTYNSRPLIAEVMVNGSDYAVVRKRQTIEELIALDTVPNWLSE